MLSVPKICFLYWNNAPMSYLHTVTLTSFHKFNPDWEIKVYNFIYPGEPSYAPKYNHYNGEDWFPQVRNMDFVEVIDLTMPFHDIHSILISDVWRRQILYETGGVYTDFDVIWLKPVSYLKDIEFIGDFEKAVSVVSYYELTKGFHNVSILISEKGNDFDKTILEAQKNVRSLHDDQAFGTTLLNWMYPEFENIPFPVLGVPYETFYPYSTYDLKKLFLENDLSVITNNTLAVHWFNGNPLSKMFINNGLYHTDCSINMIIKDVEN